MFVMNVLAPMRLQGISRLRRTARLPWLLAGLVAACVGPIAAAQASPRYNQRVLSTGLQNPRGLTLDGNRLWVSEAGAGGPRQSGGSNCVPGALAELCSGFSGEIGRAHV